MTDDTRKDHDTKDELNDKDLDQASGGLRIVHEARRADRDDPLRAEDRRAEGKPE